MRRRIARLRWAACYLLSFALFGAVALALNVVCVVLLVLPGRERYGPTVRAAIRRLFGSWLAWHHVSGVIEVEWVGFETEVLQPGTVYIANHPSIVDATFILARLPDAICIFKSSLMRNPAVGPAAAMAGYVRGDTGIGLIKAAAERVGAGQSILIFPEGTRTLPGTTLGRMKPGFALIADRAKAPVKLMIISASHGIGARGLPWWRPPEAWPGRIRITLDRTWPYEPGRSAAELTQAVESRICQVFESGKPV